MVRPHEWRARPGTSAPTTSRADGVPVVDGGVSDAGDRGSGEDEVEEEAGHAKGDEAEHKSIAPMLVAPTIATDSPALISKSMPSKITN